ncbi:hypothetical protein ACF0H5_023734 [Mactra antiquata]
MTCEGVAKCKDATKSSINEDAECNSVKTGNRMALCDIQSQSSSNSVVNIQECCIAAKDKQQQQMTKSPNRQPEEKFDMHNLTTVCEDNDDNPDQTEEETNSEDHHPEQLMPDIRNNDDTADDVTIPCSPTSNSQNHNSPTPKSQTQNFTNHHHQSQDNQNAEVIDADKWYPAKRILRQRYRNGRKQFLLLWSDRKFRQSWQDEGDVSPALKRQFQLTHNAVGKKRKRRPSQYLNKCESTDM